jgi:hypothetical protein
MRLTTLRIQSGWCDSMLRNRTSIRRRSECSVSRQAGAWSQRSARILRNACIRLSMQPTRKAADRTLGLLFIRAHVVEHLNRLRNRGNCCAYLNSSPAAVWSKSRLDEAGHRGLYNPYWLTLIGSVTKARPQYDHRPRPGSIRTVRNSGCFLPRHYVFGCLLKTVDPSPP